MRFLCLDPRWFVGVDVGLLKEFANGPSRIKVIAFHGEFRSIEVRPVSDCLDTISDLAWPMYVDAVFYFGNAIDTTNNRLQNLLQIERRESTREDQPSVVLCNINNM
jgi:hypothetical protein